MRIINSALTATIGLLLAAGASSTVFAEDAQVPNSPPPRAAASGVRLGVQGFGTAAISFPVGSDAFSQSDLKTKLFEAGGGAQVTNIWRSLFVQAAFSRWEDTGERSFIDSRGTRFGLGIPLDVEARYVDVSAGWRFENLSGSRSAQRVVPFAAAGAGVLNYKEGSPFAQAGESVDDQFTTYHALIGAEYWVTNWFAIAGDVKYRLVRDLLGTAGVSAVIDEDRFDGTSLMVRVMIGPGGPLGRRRPRPERPAAPAETTPAAQPAPQPSYRPERVRGVTNTQTPVYITPDARRAPLRTLAAGESIQVRRDAGEWLQIEFTDPQWGPRVGYVLRKNVTFSE